MKIQMMFESEPIMEKKKYKNTNIKFSVNELEDKSYIT